MNLADFPFNFIFTGRCERCQSKKRGTTFRSCFNSAEICEKCLARETSHPAYRQASIDVYNAINGGDFGWSGPGVPNPLIGPRCGVHAQSSKPSRAAFTGEQHEADWICNHGWEL